MLAYLVSILLNLSFLQLYCSATDAVKYSNVGYSGSYMDITKMDDSSCQCDQSSVSFSGTFAPLNEELSVHFRGPIKLLQFGVYQPAGGSSFNKRDEKGDEAAHKHEKRGDEGVTITSVVESALSDSTAGTSASSASSTSTGGTGSGTSSSWSQVAYFSPGSSSNVVFMNHKGDWSNCFGSALSYCASNGVDSASSPEILNEVQVGSNNEFIIFSGTQCSGNDCGCCRSASVPYYHGFGGASKMFVFEFSMPNDSGGGATNNVDMPAIWLLNAKIPRTVQYGSTSCSCWDTGCGEFDIFEVLSSGSNDMINNIHDGQGADKTCKGGGGSGATFDRPTSGSMKAVVIFNEESGSINIVKVSDDTTFGGSIDSSTVNGWLSQSASSVSF